MELSSKTVTQGALLVFLLLGTVWMWLPSDEYEIIETAQASSANGPSSTNAFEQCDVMPKRMLTVPAPSANELVLATRMLREAADPQFAADTIRLRKASDLAKTQAEIWKNNADTAKYQAEHAEAVARKNKIDAGEFSVVSEPTGGTAIHYGEVQLDENGEAVGDIPKNDTQMRFGGFNKDTGLMSMEVQGRWHKRVRIGQYVGDYKVSALDNTKDCVELLYKGDPKALYTACVN